MKRKQQKKAKKIGNYKHTIGYIPKHGAFKIQMPYEDYLKYAKDDENNN